MRHSFAVRGAPRQSALRYAHRAMRLVRPLALVWLALGCGPAAPVPSTTPPPVSAEPEPPDWLGEAQVLPVPSTGPGAVEPATPAPVFQSVARNNVVDVGFTADGSAAVTLGGDGEATLLELESGRIRAGRRVFVRRAIRRLVVSERGVAFVANGTSFGASGGLRALDLRSGRLREVALPGVAYLDVQALSIDRRSERLALVHEVEGSTLLRLQRPGGEGHDVPLAIAGFPSVLPTGSVLVRHGDATLSLRAFEATDEEPRFTVEPAPDAERLVLAVAHPEGRALFVVAPDRPLSWHDPDSGERLAEVAIDHQVAVKVLLLSGDGERLGLIRQDGTLTLRSSHEGAVIGRTQLPEGWEQAFNGPEGLHLDHDGDRLLFLGRQMVVQVPLRIGEAEPAEPSEVPLQDYTSGLVLSPDGRWLGVLGRSLTLFDLRSDTLEPRRFEPAGGEHSVWGVAWKPDESALVSYGRGGVEWWGRDGFRSTPCRGTGTVLWGDEPALHMGARRCDLGDGETEAVPAPLGTSDDGRVLVDTGRQLEVLDASGDRAGRIRKARGAGTCRYGRCVQRHALSADGEVVAYAASDHEVLVHHRRGRRLGRLRLPEDQAPVQSLALSPDGAALLVFRTTQTEGLRAGLYRVRGMRAVAETGAASGTHYAFAAAGDRLAIADGTEVVLIDTAQGRTLATHDTGGEEGVRSVSFTPGGAALIVRLPHRLRVLDRDGAPRTARDAIPLPWTVSSDAEKLVSCEAGVLVVTDLLTQETETLGDCTRGDALSFSPQGTYVTARRGSYVEVHRVADGAGLALHAPRVDANLDRRTHAYAVGDGGEYELAEDADPERFRYRRAGPMMSAPLVPLTEAPQTEGLVARFFGARATGEAGADD